MIQPDQLELCDGNAEQMTLGAMLKSPDTMDTINTILNAEDFYHPQHRELYTVAKELYDANRFDFPTLKQWLKEENKLEAVGGFDYVGQLKLSVPTLGLVKFYADKVRDYAIKRRCLQMTYDIQELTINGNFESTEAFLTAVHTKMNAIEMSKKGRMVSLKKVIGEHIRKKMNGEVKRSPLIGIPVIDQWMNGIGRDRLIVVAGRPGNGKTAFSLKTARNVAAQNFGPVPFFSLEMGHDELMDRMIADVAAVPFGAVNRSEMDETEKQNVEKSEATLAAADLFFDDTPRMDMNYIASQCRKMKREHGSLGMIVIDYLGLVSRMQRQGENDSAAIGRVTSECKQLAREIGCSVFLLCQMNREIEKRATKRPVLSDLRESGNIEQDADMVVFLHKDDDKSNAVMTHVDFIVAKGRQTGLRDFQLAFYGKYQRMMEKVL